MDSEELEKQTNRVEASSHSESGETSNSSNSLGIYLNMYGKNHHHSMDAKQNTSFTSNGLRSITTSSGKV